MRKSAIIILSTLLLVSCSENTKNNRDKETSSIEAFVKDKEYTRHESGVYYKVIKEADQAEEIAKPLITSTDTIKIWFSGEILSGYLFTTNIASLAETNGIDIPKTDLVIKEIKLKDFTLVQGLEYAIKSASKGDSLHVIIPFDLGYGSVQNGHVPPYSTLFYKIGIH